MRLPLERLTLALAAFMVAAPAVFAQHPAVSRAKMQDYEYLLMDAEAYHSEYDFDAAVESYSEALRKCNDSVKRVEIEKLLSRSRNGKSMAAYCHQPKVVSRKTFSLRDFFLYYPLPDRSWRPAPNRFDTRGGNFSSYVYFPRGSKEVYWAATDEKGVRNIYYSRDLGTMWSSPYKMPFSSSENEAFPMVSKGKLYFASRGLYGVGGYDIYVCERTPEGRWGEPRNMGFPYSSPGDDFLFITSPDGRYSIFASNRDCASDSVCVYVLEYEVMPVSHKVSSVEELQKICKLTPAVNLKRVDNKSAMSASNVADPNTALYTQKSAEVRRLREEISRLNRELSTLRAFYNNSNPEDKAAMQDKIVKKEARLPGLQSQLVAANKELQKIEMDFLLHGVLIDRSKVEAESDNEVVGVESSYTFTKRSLGSTDF